MSKVPIRTIYRDPNTLYRVDQEVGFVKEAKVEGKTISLYGFVDIKAIQSLGLDQVIFFDFSNRYVTGVPLSIEGKWEVEIFPKNIGNDNNALDIYAFSVHSANNYIFPLRIAPRVLTSYKLFVSSLLPPDSRDVPSLRDEIRSLVIRAVKLPYIARSVYNAIPTGNNYQSLNLDNSVHQGGRQGRDRFLYRLDFRGKSVIDVGANTGENSRIARRLGASLVDGYEYDPYFVEVGRLMNALSGVTRVSLFQGDCTRPELFQGMKYDVILALAVWVYMQDTLKQLSDLGDIMVFETHTLDHGIEFYYQPILKYFPYAVSLGYTEKPNDPHKSRMFIVFGKEAEVVNKMVNRKFLKIRPYFENNFIGRIGKRSRDEVFRLARRFYEKHKRQKYYEKSDYKFGTDTYFEVFLAGLFQFSENKEKGENLVGSENLYLSFLSEGIRRSQIDPGLKEFIQRPDWMIRKVSNKYEDAFSIINGSVDQVAPVEIIPDSKGKLVFMNTMEQEIKCEIFDGHHRFFICELMGIEKIHYILNDHGKGGLLEYFSSITYPNPTSKI